MIGDQRHDLNDSQRFSYFKPHGENSEFSIHQTTDILFSLAKGGLDNYDSKNIFGYVSSFTTGLVDVNEANTATTYTFEQSAFTVYGCSSNENDCKVLPAEPPPPPLGNIIETPLVSDTLPVYVSTATAFTAASMCVSRNGDQLWQVDETANFPCWAAIDVSGQNLTDVYVHVWSDGQTLIDLSLGQNEVCYRTPGPYRLEGNTGAGGGSPPSEGWVTLSTLGNSETGVQNLRKWTHTLDLTGYNWLRYYVIMRNAADQNNGVRSKVEIYDIASLPQATFSSDFLIMGDSITAFLWGAHNRFPIKVSALCSENFPEYFPMARCGAHGGSTFDLDISHSDEWISETPGQYCILAYGTNETTSYAGENDFSQNGALTTAAVGNACDRIDQIIAAGKTPILGVIPWTNIHATWESNIEILNAALAELTETYPTLLIGPDLYTLSKDQTTWFDDGIHPNATGQAEMTDAWAEWVNENITPQAITQTNAGAHDVVIEGLDENYDLYTETIAMNGTVQVETSGTFTRVFNAYVKSCGTYGSNQVGTIYLQDQAKSKTYVEMTNGKANCSRFSVPRNFTGYITDLKLSTDSSKPVSFYLNTRDNIDVTSGSMGTKKIIEKFKNITVEFSKKYITPIKIDEKSDVWFSCQGSDSGSSASASFNIILVRNDS